MNQYTGKVLLLCVLALIGRFALASAQSVDCLWAKGVGSTATDESYGVAVDTAGNVYITGRFNSASIDFDPGGSGGTLTCVGGYDAFIAKYDVNGNHLWTKSIGGSGSRDEAYGIAVDAAGNVYITGRFNSTSIDFNPGGSGGTLTRVGGYDAFIAKYDVNGNYFWAKNIGGSGRAEAYWVAVDAAGNAYIMGRFYDGSSIDFNLGGSGGMLTTAGGDYDAFIAKYDANGNYQWANGLRDINMGEDGMFKSGVVVDAAGNVYITGLGDGSVDLNPKGNSGKFTTGYYDALLAKYDPNGDYLWGKIIKGNSGSEEFSNGIAVDAADNVFIIGGSSISMMVPIDFGGGLLNPTSSGGFLAGYDPNGNYLMAVQIIGSNSYNYNRQPRGIAIHDRNIYVSGVSAPITTYNPGGKGGGTFTAAGENDIFLLKLGPCEQFTTFTESACDNFTFNGVTYTQTGVYRDTFTDVSGCDSIVTLNLTISQPSDSSVSGHYCGSFTFNGVTYTQTGVYRDTFTNASGCDSVITLDLTLHTTIPAALTVNGNVLGTTAPYSSYQWLRGGSSINGATGGSYTVTESGSYSVAVRDGNDCQDTSEAHTVTVGVRDAAGAQQDAEVYPNPAHDVLYIRSVQPVNAALYSPDGRMVLQAKEAVSLPLHGIANGVYLLRITDREGHLLKVEKVVKE